MKFNGPFKHKYPNIEQHDHSLPIKLVSVDIDDIKRTNTLQLKKNINQD